MVFFPHLVPEPKHPITQEDKEFANRLKQVVACQLSIRRKWSSSKWADEFRILRDEVGGDVARIKLALEWFTAHIKDKGVPPIRSASGFRKHFIWLEDAMKRAGVKPPPKTTDAPEVVKRVAERLKAKHWPNGSKDDVLLATLMSFDTYEEFRHRVQELARRLARAAETMPKDERRRSQSFRDFVQHVSLTSPSASTFVENWLSDVNQRITHWDDWSGDLLKWVFDPLHPQFLRQGRERAKEFCGRADRWDSMMEALKYES